MSPISALSSRLVLALGFAIAAGAASAQQGPIRFGVGVDAAYAPVFLAKREKLFEKHGVNVAEAQFREIDCQVRDFTDQDLANYREMALFLNEKGVTKSRADVEKFTQKGFYKQ